MDVAVVGIDLGKNLCSVAGMDGSGQVLLQRRMRREAVVAFIRQWPGLRNCVRNGGNSMDA